jgi:hypothetical protein
MPVAESAVCRVFWEGRRALRPEPLGLSVVQITIASSVLRGRHYEVLVGLVSTAALVLRPHLDQICRGHWFRLG